MTYPELIKYLNNLENTKTYADILRESFNLDLMILELNSAYEGFDNLVMESADGIDLLTEYADQDMIELIESQVKAATIAFEQKILMWMETNLNAHKNVLTELKSILEHRESLILEAGKSINEDKLEKLVQFKDMVEPQNDPKARDLIQKLKNKSPANIDAVKIYRALVGKMVKVNMPQDLRRLNENIRTLKDHLKNGGKLNMDMFKFCRQTTETIAFNSSNIDKEIEYTEKNVSAIKELYKNITKMKDTDKQYIYGDKREIVKAMDFISKSSVRMSEWMKRFKNAIEIAQAV